MDYQNNVTIIKEVAYYNELRNLINNFAFINSCNADYNVNYDIKK